MGNVCTSATGVLGSKTGQECLESVTTKFILTKGDFKFNSVADFGNKAKYDEAILAGEIAPLADVYEFANANTEASFYESLNFKKETAKAVKVYNAEAYLSLCSHSILKSYENSDFVRVFEVTQDGFIIGVLQADGSVRGQLMKSFDVGIRNSATKDKVPFTPIVVTFADYEELEDNPVIVDPDFNPNMDLGGIQEVRLNIDSATATKIVINPTTYCGGQFISGLTDTNLEFLKADGSVQTIASVTEDSTAETITLSGTSFVAGEVRIKGLVDVNGLTVKSKGYKVII